MTEKRFIIDYCNRRIIDNEKNEYLQFLVQFKEALNELNDENEQLKRQISNLEHTKDFCEEYCERLEKLYLDELNTLNDENEQLKKEVDELEQENEQLENKLLNCQNSW